MALAAPGHGAGTALLLAVLDVAPMSHGPPRSRTKAVIATHASLAGILRAGTLIGAQCGDGGIGDVTFGGALIPAIATNPLSAFCRVATARDILRFIREGGPQREGADPARIDQRVNVST